MRAALLVLLLAGCGGATPFGVIFNGPMLGGPDAFVWVADDKSVFVVGQDPANQQALIAVSHDDSIDWGSADFSQAGACSAVFGFGSLDVWVAAAGLVLHTTDGSSFKALPAAPNVGTWRAIWGPSADHVYVAGDAGLIHSTDGGAHFVTAIPSAVTSVWGSGPADVYAVDASGRAWHSSDGDAFTSTPLPGGGALSYVGGSGAGDVFAGGLIGNLFHSTDRGATFTELAGGPEGGQAIWGAPDGDVFIVGSLGLWHTDNGGQSADFSTAPTGGAISGNAVGDLYVVGAGHLYHRVR